MNSLKKILREHKSTLTWDQAVGCISYLNEENSNGLYLIIYRFYIRNEGDLQKNKQPYDGQITIAGKGISFNEEKIPDELKEEICTYISYIRS